MKSIVVASSCACAVTSIAWSIAVLIFAEPPPALAEESPRVRELEVTILELKQSMEDMRRKLHGLSEAQVWRMQEPEVPAVAEPTVNPSSQLLAEIQQKNGEITALASRVDGIEEYLRYGSEFKPVDPEPQLLAESLDAARPTAVRYWALDQLGSAGGLLTADHDQVLRGRTDQVMGTLSRLLNAQTLLQTQKLVQEIEVISYAADRASSGSGDDID